MRAEGKCAHQTQDEIAVFLAREHLQDARALGHEIGERGPVLGHGHWSFGGHAESGMYPLTLSFSTLMSAARMMPSAYSLPALTISVCPIRRKPGDSWIWPCRVSSGWYFSIIARTAGLPTGRLITCPPPAPIFSV